MSIKYRIVMLFVALVTLIVTLGSLSVYFFSVKERQDTFRIRLKNRALSTARVFAGSSDSNLSLLRRMDTTAVSSLYDKSIAIVGNNSFSYTYAENPSDSLVLTKDIIKKTQIEGEFYFTYKNKKAVAVQYIDKAANFIVAVAATDVDGQDYLRQLKGILLFSLVLAAAFSFLAGILFAKSLITPIKNITKEVNLISTNDFSQRIKLNNSRDELTQLAETFNHLLDRLQDSFHIQRRFISNASHELSTPLTSISSQVEVALQKRRTPEEYMEVMQSVSEDIRELQQLTHSLLDIAKTGSQGSIDLTEVRLDEVLLKVVSEIQNQNVGFQATLNFDVFPDDEKLLCIFGNANLLYIAFKNIIENGCKYADNHLSDIAVIFDKAYVLVTVANKGDIIAEADIQNIFQPFFRTDSAQKKPGFGLGLTLTKRIISLHKGTVKVESNPEKGTIFTIELPNILAMP
ncbi:MAG: HAMP domain-containing sensor histidine kinase [Ferruginibacter sp.]